MTKSKVFLAIAALLALAGPAGAQTWKRAYPELVYMVVPNNQDDEPQRFSAFVAYLGRAIGTRIRLEVAKECDVAGDQQKKKRVHIAHYCGAATFARARISGVPIEPFAIDANEDGTTGYYSVFFVRQDGDYRRIEDLRGRILGLGYQDSTSSDLEPRFMLHQKAIVPEKFFSSVVYTGGPVQSIEALRAGKIDVAAATSDIFTTYPELDAKQFRAILTSELLPLAPIAYLAALPPDLKLAIRRAFLEVGNKDAAAFAARAGVNQTQKPWQLADLQTYQHTIEMMKFVDRLRR